MKQLSLSNLKTNKALSEQLKSKIKQTITNPVVDGNKCNIDFKEELKKFHKDAVELIEPNKDLNVQSDDKCLICKSDCDIKNHFKSHINSHSLFQDLVNNSEILELSDKSLEANNLYFKFKINEEELKMLTEITNNTLQQNIIDLDISNYSSIINHNKFITNIKDIKEILNNTNNNFQQRENGFYFHKYFKEDQVKILSPKNALENLFNDLWISLSSFTGTILHIDTNDYIRKIKNIHYNLCGLKLYYFFVPPCIMNNNLEIENEEMASLYLDFDINRHLHNLIIYFLTRKRSIDLLFLESIGIHICVCKRGEGIVFPETLPHGTINLSPVTISIGHAWMSYNNLDSFSGKNDYTFDTYSTKSIYLELFNNILCNLQKEEMNNVNIYSFEWKMLLIGKCLFYLQQDYIEDQLKYTLIDIIKIINKGNLVFDLIDGLINQVGSKRNKLI
ncbi:predicted protein [Naegleria gruberi]|uniref:Predicted protein n=1 Tax=Naegleria gruberi TaxID=5762 RepID=D2V902_NAEGR|nr:uncharacterized protein NAEGRDRAFT_65342 [Naegleria gruberi]EFC46780.1 predicted protein [Naegleria gruberi]|eukprot:XP_002679524.1 predicted protein [Naegleria gruberi strain NEG-M]